MGNLYFCWWILLSYKKRCNISDDALVFKIGFHRFSNANISVLVLAPSVSFTCAWYISCKDLSCRFYKTLVEVRSFTNFFQFRIRERNSWIIKVVFKAQLILFVDRYLNLDSRGSILIMQIYVFQMPKYWLLFLCFSVPFVLDWVRFILGRPMWGSIFIIQNGLIILGILAAHTKSFLFCLLYSDTAELPLNPVNPSAPDMEQEIVSVEFMYDRYVWL